jgi:hypothetical protein
VAGFAEGRNEIDADFIDTVVTAQGGALEGEENGEGIDSKIIVSSSQMGKSEGNESGNNLKTEVMALEGRLTRMEGLMLEMTSQLIPAFSIILPRVITNLPAELTLIGKEQDSMEAETTGQNLTDEFSPPPPRRWWSKLWQNQ